MQIERLETRVVLSVSLFNGQLAIVGSTMADSIALDAAGSTLTLVFNGNASNFTLSQVHKISISAAGGNDTVTLTDAVSIPAIIHGGSGNDSLRGGAGPDSLLGEAGNDTLDGAGGADVMFGGAGIDTADYSARTNDLIITIDDNAGDGEAGENDNIGTGVENIIAGSGNDNITGSAGNNSVVGGAGNDTLTGASGNDTIDGGTGADDMHGNGGLDTVTYASRTAGVTIKPGLISGEAGENDTVAIDFETLIGGSGNDILIEGLPFIASQLPDLRIEGGPGNDALQGGYGNDTLLGGPGDDGFTHDLGNDRIDGGTGINSLELQEPENGPGGAHVSLDGIANDGFGSEVDNYLNITNIHGSNAGDTITGDGKDNLIDGFLGEDSIDGGGGDDLVETSGGGTLIGGAGNDTLQGGIFNIHPDIRDMEGGPGDDQLFPPSADIQTLTGDAGNDSVRLGFNKQNGRVFDFSTAGFETIIGSNAAEVLIGGPGDETFLGLDGKDTIEGNGGNDYIDGGPAQDSLDGGDGNDVFVNASGVSPTPGQIDADTVDGGDGVDFAQDGGLLNGAPFDALTNIEFIYDPHDIVSATAPMGSIVGSAAPLAAAGGDLSGGVLAITGTSGDDSISVIFDSTGQHIQLTFNGAATLYPVASVKRISIDAGNGNDQIALIKSDGTRAVSVNATVNGGAGNDSIRGGDGNDSIVGGFGNDTLGGERGNDVLNGGVETLGANSDGADKINGGPGNDSVLYSFRTDDLTIDIADTKKSNDGGKSESDNVAADVENVFSGDGNDKIQGNSSANLLCGGGGNDSLMGGAGIDKLIGSRGDDLLLGEDARNLYSAADGARDDLDGAPFVDFISGDAGVDFSTKTGKFI